MTAGECVRNISDRLKKAGIPSYRLDAELLVSHILEIPPMRLLIDGKHEVVPPKMTLLEKCVKRRERREPLAYITGRKEFYSLEFDVSSDVLIPRPETEFVVDAAILHTPRNGSLLDICCGSGAIAIAVKHERPDCRVYASDVSSSAIDVARTNAKRIVSADFSDNFCVGDLFSCVHGDYDVITANPPYVSLEEKSSLQPELSHEPEIALFASNKGLSLVERILEEAPLYLKDAGVLVMEIHSGKVNYIKSMAQKLRFNVGFINDYAGLPRVALLKRS